MATAVGVASDNAADPIPFLCQKCGNRLEFATDAAVQGSIAVSSTADRGAHVFSIAETLAQGLISKPPLPVHLNDRHGRQVCATFVRVVADPPVDCVCLWCVHRRNLHQMPCWSPLLWFPRTNKVRLLVWNSRR